MRLSRSNIGPVMAVCVLVFLNPVSAFNAHGAAIKTTEAAEDNFIGDVTGGKNSREYIIQEGDVLFISVWLEEDLREEVIVRPDGRISFPLAGDIRAAGLTFGQLKEKITNRLTEYIKHPEVSISFRKLGGRKVVVMGAVKNAGVYYISGEKTVLEAIAHAGGFIDSAAPSSVTLIREGIQDPKGLKIDLTNALNKTDVSQNISLQADDIIYVASASDILERRKVIVLGEVRTPGVYYVTGGKSVLEAIASANGFTDDSVPSSVMLIRGGRENPEGKRINLNDAITGSDGGQNVEIQNEDIVYVPKKFIADVNYFMRQILGPITAGGTTVKTLSK